MGSTGTAAGAAAGARQQAWQRPQDLPKLSNWMPGVAGEGIFSAEECDRIIALRDEMRSGAAEGDQGQAGDGPKIRDSKICWVQPRQEQSWLFGKLMQICQQVNQQHFGLSLFGYTEPLQISEYGEGSFFDWHLDMGNGRYSVRKLSFVVQLSDPGDYEGGDLQVMGGPEPFTFPRSRGAMALFPSYILHRVTPVTRGTRMSAVGWIGGPHLT
jgi:PKHD-type hydroxylase